MGPRARARGRAALAGQPVPRKPGRGRRTLGGGGGAIPRGDPHGPARSAGGNGRTRARARPWRRCARRGRRDRRADGDPGRPRSLRPVHVRPAPGPASDARRAPRRGPAMMLGLLLAAVVPASPPPVFEASVAKVYVDAFVTSGDRPVRGLRAEDFELSDDGVPQQVEMVGLEQAPLTVVLALDVS